MPAPSVDAERIRNAIALAACQAAGLRIGNGTDAKAYLVGRTAELGVESARASKAGIDAPADVFEGVNGFFQLVANGEADQSVTPGVPYKLLHPGVVIKQYPLCKRAAGCRGVAGTNRRAANRSFGSRIDPLDSRFAVSGMTARQHDLRSSSQGIDNLPSLTSRD